MKKHGENCTCAQELSEIIGTALTRKLHDDTVRAARVTEKELAELTLAAIKVRSGLSSDELPALPDSVKDAVLGSMKGAHSEMLLCGVLRLAVTLSLNADETMADFVGHAARHYEEELVRRSEVVITETQAQSIKDAAVRYGGKSN